MTEGLSPTDFPCTGTGRHSPKPARTVLHHVVPLSWGGPDVPANKVVLCDNHHYGAHTAIDEYVRLSEKSWPTWTHPAPALLAEYDGTMRALALKAVQGYQGTTRPPFTL